MEGPPTGAGSTAISFIGSHYEVKGSEISKHYFAGTTRIATRKTTIPQTNTLEYTLTDHLNSTAITTDSAGAKVSELKYTPWGKVRYTWTAEISASLAADSPLNLTNTATLPYSLTRYSYTGQYSDSYINLLWYGFRHYDPALGRFTQPDTIVPEQAQGTQAWDRYAYVNNNPLKYSDPTGHTACDQIPAGPSRDACNNSEYGFVEKLRDKAPQKDLENRLKNFRRPKKEVPIYVNFLDLWGGDLTPSELKMLLERPLEGWGAFAVAGDANVLAASLLPFLETNSNGDEFNNGHNNPQDAFRHAYGSALLTSKFGASYAQGFTDAHEYTTKGPIAEAFMDLHNNSVGINIAQSNPDATPANLARAVYKALTHGQLYVWTGRYIYYSNQCPQCPNLALP